LDRAGKRFFPSEAGYIVVGAPGWAPDGPAPQLRIADCEMRIEIKSEIRNPKSEINAPMLFPRNALASGPQVCFSMEERIVRLKGRRRFLCCPPVPGYVKKKDHCG